MTGEDDVFYQVFSLGIKVLKLGEIHKKYINNLQAFFLIDRDLPTTDKDRKF